MMRQPNDLPDLRPFVHRLALLSFGLGVLAFLIAIEHQNWFQLKPATGTAAAMSYASDRQPTA